MKSATLQANYLRRNRRANDHVGFYNHVHIVCVFEYDVLVLISPVKELLEALRLVVIELAESTQYHGIPCKCSQRTA